jgi:hypothetical protein
VFLKFVEEVQTMAAAEVELNPPVSPFSKGDSLPWAPNPSLEKRGRGDFWTEYSGGYAANFWVRILELSCYFPDSLRERLQAAQKGPDTRRAKIDEWRRTHVR